MYSLHVTNIHPLTLPPLPHPLFLVQFGSIFIFVNSEKRKSQCRLKSENWIRLHQPWEAKNRVKIKHNGNDVNAILSFITSKMNATRAKNASELNFCCHCHFQRKAFACLSVENRFRKSSLFVCWRSLLLFV